MCITLNHPRYKNGSCRLTSQLTVTCRQDKQPLLKVNSFFISVTYICIGTLLCTCSIWQYFRRSSYVYLHFLKLPTFSVLYLTISLWEAQMLGPKADSEIHL